MLPPGGGQFRKRQLPTRKEHYNVIVDPPGRLSGWGKKELKGAARAMSLCARSSMRRGLLKHFRVLTRPSVCRVHEFLPQTRLTILQWLIVIRNRTYSSPNPRLLPTMGLLSNVVLRNLRSLPKFSKKLMKRQTPNSFARAVVNVPTRFYVKLESGPLFLLE